MHVFSSGGVAPPVKKCGEDFEKKSGTEIEFTVGKAEDLLVEIARFKRGDILTCGSEFILDEAQLKGLVLLKSREGVSAFGRPLFWCRLATRRS